MPFTPDSTLVWTEIPATDLEAAVAFYQAVFDWNITIEDDGPNPTAMFMGAVPTGAGGHLYPGKPSTDGSGPTPHLAVPDTVEETMERLIAAGGTKVSDVITIPVGRFAYAQDPDGNSISLFQGNAA